MDGVAVEGITREGGRNVSSTSCYITVEAATILLNRYGFRDVQEVRDAIAHVVGKVGKK